MENHYFDENGIYTGSAPAYPGTVPPDNALRDAPPRKDGHWPVRDVGGTGWILVEDHRGREGWLNGRPAMIAAPGPLPEGWKDTPSNQVEDTEEVGPAPLSSPPADNADSVADGTKGMVDRMFYLTSSGTWHAEGCTYTRSAGQWLRLGDIRSGNPKAKPCARCRPDKGDTP